jgi:hypothetical protein
VIFPGWNGRGAGGGKDGKQDQNGDVLHGVPFALILADG